MTDVRGLDVPVVDGCRVLTSETIGYSDGAEQRVFDIVESAHDLSSTSDELAVQSTTWAERYHLSTGRANLLRPFALPPAGAVLEIGAGCGAITRYLGERCGSVDALEPVLARARVARSRTRDLDHVEVYVGSLGDVPAEPAYDLVVVVGVLEYVGDGASDLVAQSEFLRGIGRVLRPGGSLILAIENRLGVKYVAGAGEDHTRRVYDGVEGYPEGAPVRTYSRTELADLLCGVGLQPTFYAAFPDYKLTRTIMADSLFQSDPALAWRIPQFPSPDRSGVSARGVNEEHLWRALVDDGVGPHFANSFVVTASTGPEPAALWPPDRLAGYYQPDRRARYSTQTLVSRRDGVVRFARSPLRPADEETAGPIPMTLEESTLVPGRDLLEVLEQADEAELRDLLQRWVARADQMAADAGGYALDLFHHNFVQGGDGELRVIDEEWGAADVSRPEFLARGAFVTAWKLALRTPPGRWPCETVAELVVHLGAMFGLPESGEWLTDTVRREAAVESEILIETGWDLRAETQLDSIAAGLEETLTLRLADLPMGDRDHQRLEHERRRFADEHQRFTEQHAQYMELVGQFNEEREARNRAVANLQRLKSSRSWRMTEPFRKLSRRAGQWLP